MQTIGPRTITIRTPSVCISNVSLRYGDQAHWSNFNICILNSSYSISLDNMFRSIKQRIESGSIQKDKNEDIYRNFSDHSRRGNFIVVLNSLRVSTNALPPCHNSLLLVVATVSYPTSSLTVCQRWALYRLIWRSILFFQAIGR